jgi:putative SOS response-associated peptidase YedK
MCGRVTQFERFAEIPQRLGLRPSTLTPRYNLAPTQPLLTVRRTEGSLRCEALRWGLLVSRPGRPIEPGTGHVNARAETVTTLPAFRDAVRSRRCLVPVDGFYEWRNDGQVAVTFYFERADGGPLAMAGLWASHLGENGGLVTTVCLVTTAPNRDMSPVHGRMPVLLAEADWQTWLTEYPLASAELTRLTRPSPDGALRLRRVGTEVNRAAPDHPDLLAPASPANLQGDFMGELLSQPARHPPKTHR